jgi:hypothetical protein
MLGISYAKKGLVRISRKDGKSTVLRPATAGPRPCSDPVPSDEGCRERAGRALRINEGLPVWGMRRAPR